MFSIAVRFKQALIVILASIPVNYGLAQAIPPAQLESVAIHTLARITDDDAQLEQVISNAYGVNLTQEKRAVTKSMLGALLKNDRLPQYLAKLLTPVLSQTLTLAEGKAYMLEGVMTLQAKGLRRLSNNRQAQYVQYLVDMAEAIPASVCKAMFLGKLDTRTAAAVERRYIASLSLGRFESIMALYQDSAEAELAGYPDVKKLNTVQAKGAERAYEMAMSTRLLGLPPGLNDRVLRDIEAADPREACLWFRTTTSAALDLTDPYRSWYLTRFTENLQ